MRRDDWLEQATLEKPALTRLAHLTIVQDNVRWIVLKTN
jgi:hypothetical protein